MKHIKKFETLETINENVSDKKLLKDFIEWCFRNKIVRPRDINTDDLISEYIENKK